MDCSGLPWQFTNELSVIKKAKFLPQSTRTSLQVSVTTIITWRRERVSITGSDHQHHAGRRNLVHLESVQKLTQYDDATRPHIQIAIRAKKGRKRSSHAKPVPLNGGDYGSFFPRRTRSALWRNEINSNFGLGTLLNNCYSKSFWPLISGTRPASLDISQSELSFPPDTKKLDYTLLIVLFD